MIRQSAIILSIVLLPFTAFAQDTKVYDMTTEGTPALTDFFYLTDSGYVDRKLSIGATLGTGNDLDSNGDVADNSHNHLEANVTDLTHTTDTGPSPDCAGTTTYQDGEGGCDDISLVYAPIAHVSADGSSHTFIDQSVVSGGSPTFDGNNFTGMDANDVDIADAGALITATDVEGALQENRPLINTNTTHSGGDGSDHANVATNTTHSGGDGSDHADVASNTTHRTSTGADHTYIDQSVISGSTPTFTGTNFTGVPATGISGTDVGTDLTADLEEEGEINATVVTGNAADDSMIMGTGASTGSYIAMPTTGTNGCSGSADKILYNTTTNTWSCGTDAGAGGGMTSFNVQADDTNTVTISDAETLDIAGGLGLKTTAAAGTPEQITVDYDYSQTLVGNPALGIDECIFSGGGILCEGTTADNFEGLLVFPFTTSDKTVTFQDVTGTVYVTGGTDVVDDDVADDITLTNITQITTRSHTSLTDIGTDSHATLDAHLDDVTGDPHAIAGDTLTFTNKTIDADGTGNSITNIENADIKAGAAISVSKTALTAGRSLTLSGDDVLADAELYTDTIGFAIEDPTAADSFLFWKAPQAVTLTSVDCIIGGSTNAVIDVNECTTSGGSCTTTGGTPTCISTGATDATFSDAAIASGAWLSIDVDSISGTPDYVTITITYTKDD